MYLSRGTTSSFCGSIVGISHPLLHLHVDDGIRCDIDLDDTIDARTICRFEDALHDVLASVINQQVGARPAGPLDLDG